FMDPQVWDQLPKWRQSLHLFNNTLLGRMFLGPVLSQIAFMRADLRLILAGDRRVALGWLLHVHSLIVAYVMVVMVADVPIWLWVLAAYLSMAILKIRTYLEHRVHDHPRGRSVVVEDRGLLSFLFLNNNFHSVHHAHPSVPWYALPRLFASKRDRFLAMNDGYHFGCYGEVIRKFAIKRKDPVAHPNWSQKTVE
ncbi:MAG: fatty acid desaturase, partial [Rhodobacteraceae bacterium]|nr:fatty acid desaturase [Paracoccaceae bacterium]NCX85159.1 fatty acid desaturase [Paracoccaceae bacterium]